MTPHIEAREDAYAETALLPGDQNRAKWIAETYFEECKEVNNVRGALGYTGMYRLKPISVQSGGMGMPSNAIYITELFKFYNVKTIIRVGSCGGIANDLKVGDIVAATTASTDSNMTKDIIPGVQNSPSCDTELLLKFKKKYKKAKIGTMMSSDYFYNPDKNHWRKLREYGHLAIDMETHILYTLAQQFKRKALSVNTVADTFTSDDKLTPEERSTGFKKMVDAVLNIC